LVTIHSEHPFMPPEEERDPARQLRARIGGTVSLWTTGSGSARSGLTVSSYLVAPGEPARLIGLLDPDSDLAEQLPQTRTAIVQMLEWPHRDLADAFAGVAPAPGGVFRMGEWEQTEWGPRLSGAGTWAGVRMAATAPRQVGWSLMVETTIERVEIGEDAAPLVHRRGRYQRPAG
jgi:flavin reductase (DIM6/NTAB) family NADH-FMN oxidoreductase RutF